MTAKNSGSRVTTPAAANETRTANTPIVPPPAMAAKLKPDARGRAIVGPPSPGRTKWLIAVLTCPLCGGMHHHRVADGAELLAGRMIRVCPTTGHDYQLSPVQRRREARRG